jgi:hypothetical protein
MKIFRWLPVVCAACLCFAGCGGKHRPRKPDPTKGAVTGVVICDDTGKPARFATVTLTAVIVKDGKVQSDGPLPPLENAETDLDGRFRMEAVEPGHYYAFATLEGYLDPMRGVDFAKLESLSNDQERSIEAIREWKDRMVEVTVAVHRASEVTVHLSRASEIAGTVTYDDGSPAIGMHFELLRKTDTNGWTGVGLALFNNWKFDTTSDGHGRYVLTNLPAGEYKVCALLPDDDEDAAPRVCLGNTFRSRNSLTVKVQAGETAAGTDIVIPLTGLRNIAGTVTAVSDGHAVGRAKLQLLYADDREVARKTSLAEDGSFAFDLVPDGRYILQVTGAADVDQNGSGTPKISTYQDKEMPLVVAADIDDVNLAVVSAPQVKPAKH